jgi:hypothetical protein
MPRYLYECEHCCGRYVEFHSLSETHNTCKLCNKMDKIKKVPGNIFVFREKLASEQNKKVGEVTVDHIEENKEILKKIKEERKELKDG